MKNTKLFSLRVELGLHQDAFAELLRGHKGFAGVSKSTISRWETKPETLPPVKWARILGALGKPYEPMTEVVGDKSAPVSAQEAADQEGRISKEQAQKMVQAAYHTGFANGRRLNEEGMKR